MKKTTWLPLAILLVPTLLSAQGVPLPPRLEATAPTAAGLEEAGHRPRQVSPDPEAGLPARERAIRALEAVRPGATRPENLRGGNPLPAAAQTPAELRAAEERERPAQAAPMPAAPTRAELLEQIRHLPGGAERLQEATRRGAPIPTRPGTQRGGTPDRIREVLASLNPFQVAHAWAQSKFSVTVTAKQQESATPYARLRFYGANTFYSDNSAFELVPGGITLGGLTHTRTTPYAQLHVCLPASGWYIISFRAFHGSGRAQLYHTRTDRVVATWDYSGRWGWESFPALVEVTQGCHVFVFQNSGANYIDVSEASASAL
jgi:hypothetical protein